MKNLRSSRGISFSSVGARTRGSILALLVALAGCGGDDDDELNMGKFCSTVGGAFCDRLISCGSAQSSQKTGCVDAFVEGCCKDDGECNDKPENAAAEVALQRFMDECSAALKTHACNQLQSSLPAACTAAGARLVSPNQTPVHPVPATFHRSGDSDHPYNMGRTTGRALRGR
jgi:hypothetical protein